ncbi:MAG: serine/threonine protein kinase [Planctomycetes bacterium]|nr:serine/threonine protein kinase [Planctomycetota bacterium]
MISSTTATMLADLRRLKIVPEDAVHGIEVAIRPGNETPEELTPILLAAGLTDFQAQVALAGQTSRLVFGSFVLLDKIGEGGMGVVYRALQSRLGRVEALKVIRSDKISSSTVAKRFMREIELTSSLEHPHIVRAYDAGEIKEQLYLATEYVPGTDLATYVDAHGPLSIADACLSIYQTTLALQHVHEKGLVHRDLKPSNLIRDRHTGAVKILDMGLSGFSRSVMESGVAGGGTLTRDGVVLGTPDFMAPEQVQDPHHVDIRADLYSLGCTFYFLLTGELPFTGTAVEKLYFHGFAPPPPLKLPAGVVAPPGLPELIARLMAKKPEERFQTPQELLGSLLAIRPITEDVPSKPVAVAVAHQTPFPTDHFGAGDFDHLLSSTGSTNSYVLPKEPEPPPPARLSWLTLLTVALFMFSSGFLAATLYFAKWIKWTVS